jgi:hypothetical protein
MYYVNNNKRILKFLKNKIKAMVVEKRVLQYGVSRLNA